MKTHEVIQADAATLSAELKAMKIKELERHATKILRSVGNADYEEVMRSVIKALPEIEERDVDTFVEVQNLIHVHFNLPSHAAPIVPEMLERITVIMMVIISKKYEKIHSGQPVTS